MQKPKTLPNLELEPKTSYSAVEFATTKPVSLNISMYECNNKYVLLLYCPGTLSRTRPPVITDRIEDSWGPNAPMSSVCGSNTRDKNLLQGKQQS